VPRYSTVGSSGPEHAKVFVVEVRIGDAIAFRGTGSSKKSASQHAAMGLIEQLKAVELFPKQLAAESPTGGDEPG